VVVRNTGQTYLTGTVSLQLTDSEGPLSSKWERTVSIPVGGETAIQDVDLRADPAALLQVAEQRRGLVVASLVAEGSPIYRSEIPVRVLAANQWMNAAQLLDYELLCAFVIPNHPSVVEA